MKKFLCVILGCVAAFAAAGCSCNDGDAPSAGDNMPSIPEGVNLAAVAKGDIAATLEDFTLKYRLSDDLYVDYYKSYKNSASSGSTRFECRVYGDNALCENCAGVFGDLVLTDREQSVSDVQYNVKLRGDSCGTVKNGTLSAMAVNRYHGNSAPMDYMMDFVDGGVYFAEDIRNIVGLLADGECTAEVRADSTRLYADISSGSGYAYRFYMDTAAGLNANSFGNATPTAAQTADILYYTADSEALLRDFMDSKEIKLYPAGGGDASDFNNRNMSVVVQYNYDGKNGHTSLNLGLDEGELLIPAEAYESLCSKISGTEFDIKKLNMFYFELEIRYEKNGKRCVSTILVDY